MIVAGIQIKVSRYSRTENLARAEEFVRKAAREGAKIICLQEYFATGSFTREKAIKNFDLAETIQSDTISRMCKLAKEESICLIVPLFEKDDEIPGRHYNSAIVIDDNGRTVGRYRKQFIAESQACEKYYFSPGNLGTPVFEFCDIRFGIAICYDRHFFEISRIIVLKGAHIIFIPTATYRPKSRANFWRSELITLAAVNGIYVMGVNSTGFQDGKDQFGESTLVDPSGRVMSSLEGEEGFISGDVSVEIVTQARIDLPVLRDYRKEVLEELWNLYQKEI
jgi:N-carbamoylputrescine amidase